MPATANQLKRTHAVLCYQRAFPDSVAKYREAASKLRLFDNQMSGMPRSTRNDLHDTGIAGTLLHYPFSYAVATWLARKVPGEVSIDWQAIDGTTKLDDMLAHLLLPAEDEYFDGGNVSSREWIDTLRKASAGTDFDWLMRQLGEGRYRRFRETLYDAVELPLVWSLAGSRFSKSRNARRMTRVSPRQAGMRKRPTAPKPEIRRPLESIERLSKRDGARLIDIAMASLAARHRETYHFNHANPEEVYLADVGEGVAIAVFGLLPAYRFPLECTMGYLILANGVPIGYGGSSILFRQVNTGINIFDEYRDSEASYLWVQVMRVYHAISGCTRFIANAYQFGADNSEALKSGAFWFYYRLGFRPVAAAVRDLARREARKIRRDRKHQSDIRTLRQLSSCDLHLALPGARASDLFEERWIEVSSMLATRVLGASGGRTRNESAKRVAQRVAQDLGLQDLQHWSAHERQAFTSIAPFVALADVKKWSGSARHGVCKLLRAKGGCREARYARLLSAHDEFLDSLRRACRRAERAR